MPVIDFQPVTPHNTSWLVSLSYKIARDILIYGRVSSGYRSGGVNPRALTVNTFSPEKARAYEIGAKSDLLNRHLRLNVAGFVTKHDDLQVTQFPANAPGASTIIVNAGKVQLKGRITYRLLAASSLFSPHAGQ